MPLDRCYRSLAGTTEWFGTTGAVEFKPFKPVAVSPGFGGTFDASWSDWAGPTLLRLEPEVWLIQDVPELTAYREIPEHETRQWFRDHHAHLRFDHDRNPDSSNALSSWELEKGFPSALFSNCEAARLRVSGGVPGAARRLAESIRVVGGPYTDRDLATRILIESVENLQQALPQADLIGDRIYASHEEMNREISFRALREILGSVAEQLGGEIDAPLGMVRVGLGPMLLDFDHGLPEALDRIASRLEALDAGPAPASSTASHHEPPPGPEGGKTPEATVPEAAVASPVLPIVLGEPDDGPFVRGKQKNRMTPGQYRVVKALLDAHPERLSKDTLARRSDTESPIGMIDRLRRDPDWASVLDKPGQAHGGYGIRVKPLRKAAPRKG